MRSFVYCRVSTREQSSKDHYSLDNQETRCRDYAAMKKWRVAKVRKDVASGKSGEGREGFQELLSDIEGGRIVDRLDRLSRNVRDIYDFLDTIRRGNVGFVSVTEGFDTTTAMGRAMLGVAAVFAQLTREMIAENTKDGLLRRAEAGLFTGSMANAYGYRYSPEQETMVPHPEEAPVVRDIFHWYTDNKWGQFKIARVLNVKGVPTKKLGEEGQWATNTIARIIRNPIYCGLIRIRDGKPASYGGAEGSEQSERLIQGIHEPLISRELFEAAQQIMKSRQDIAPRAQGSVYLLSGIATCGYCGRKLRAHYQTKRLKDGSKAAPFISYHHISSEEVKGDRACNGVSIGANKLEAAVIKTIAEASQSETLQRLAVEEVAARQQDGSQQLQEERDKLAAELVDIGSKFTQWADRLDSGAIDEEQFNVQNRRLLKRKQEIQKRQLELADMLMEREEIEVTLEEVKQALAQFPKVWEALELEEKREMLRLLVEELRIFKDR